jgi:hypothetical protein
VVQITIGSDATLIDKRKEHSLRHSEDALVYLFDLSRKLWRARIAASLLQLTSGIAT